MVRPFAFLTVALLVLSGCGADSVSETSGAPGATSPTGTASASAVTILESPTTTEAEFGARAPDTLRILTYNIFQGGDAWAGGEPTDLLDTLLAYDADIVGLQEANGWDQDGFARIEEISAALGMEYAYCKARDGIPEDASLTWDTIILSRFEILSAAAYPEIRQCVGVVEVRLPDGRSLHVVNLHLPEGQSQCTDLLDKAFAIVPPADDLAVIMGDFNFADSNPPDAHPCNEKMLTAEWTELTCELSRCGQIDRIWVSKSLADLEYFPWIANYLVDLSVLSNISDHRPTAADIFALLE